nr:PAS domain S-box protein [Methanobacterium formicicum]
MENYFIYPDGTGRWFDLRVFPVPEGIFILSIDITDRKQVEEELIASKEFNENIIKSMGDGFSILDKNGVHLDVNPALCQMTGFSREELIGTGLPHPYWPEEKAHDIQATLEEVLKGNLKEVELTFKRKNGEKFPVILSPSIITDDEGKVIAVFGTFKDITQRKKLEMELKESEQKFRGLVENAADALFVHDMKGNIRDVNQQSVESLGYSREELLRMNVMEIEQDFELESARKEWREIKPGEPFTLYGHQKRKDGTVFPVEIHFAAVEIKQEKLVMGLVRDITAIKKAEEELKAINRALMKRDEEFRHFIDSAPVAIAMFDPKMQYIAASQRWIEDYNLYGQELLGRSHYDIFPEIPDKLKKSSPSCSGWFY